jgi:vacuolar-type H+-ATPase subunit H
MSIEYLKKIRETEEQAEKIRRDALAESKRIVSVAMEEASSLVENAKNDAETSYKKTLLGASDIAAADYDKILNEAKWEHKMLLEASTKNTNKAIEVIVRKVVS